MKSKRGQCFLLVLAFVLVAPFAHAEGESVNGFPNWSERVLLEWMNRARSDPAADLAGCTPASCAEKACYSPVAPRHADPDLLHSSRFHAAHMAINNYFSHPSQCTLVANIANAYPQSCNGSASCSCTQGALTTDQTKWTDPFTRIGYFGASGSGEIIAAGYPGPDATFYAWLYEPSPTATCGYSGANGHRYLILTDSGDPLAGAGYAQGGSYGTYADMDFGYPGTPGTSKIPSGSHYPQQAATVAAWANWYDTNGPSAAKINIDGVCSDMQLSRGNASNGAWKFTANNVGTGCHRYNFQFKDSAGHAVLYPTTGSLAIGDGSAQCPDWSAAAPPVCAGTDLIFANGFDP